MKKNFQYCFDNALAYCSRVPWQAYRILRNPSLHRENILDFQNKQLRWIMAYAYKNVPFYKEIYDKAGISPDDVRHTSDLRYLPLVSRKDLQEQPLEKILSKGIHPSKLIIRRTTGSTGEPLAIRRAPYEELVSAFFRLRVMQSYRIRRRDRVARIGTRTRKETPLVWRIIQLFGQYRQEQIYLLESPAEMAKKVLLIKPDIITGNSSVLARLSKEFHSLPKDSLMIRCIVSGAEVLTPMMKREISRVFGAPVYDTYASEELDLMAWECKETGLYHVCEDNLILEVLKDGLPAAKDERGEVVATSLHFFAMPFIRYRLGDEITVGERVCPCGQPFSTIKALEGRKTDYLVLPGGKELFASSIAYILHEKAAWINKYELVQEKEDMVVLKVVADKWPPRYIIDSLAAEIQGLLGRDVNFLIKSEDELQPGPGGKYRILRSFIRSHYNSTGNS